MSPPDRLRHIIQKQERMVLYGVLGFGGFGLLTVLMGAFILFDDPAGLVVILFGLIFIGAAVLVVRLFSPAEGKRHVAVGGDEFAAARHDGTPSRRTSTFLIEVDEDATAEEVAAAEAAYHARRFAERNDWVDGRIEAESQRSGGAHKLAAFVWTIFAMLAVGAALIWGDIAWFVAAGGVLVASALVFKTVKEAAQLRKFGESAFVMAPGSAKLGGALEGVVETSIPYDRMPEGGFRLVLSCERRWEEHTTESSASPTRTILRVDDIWTTEAHVEPEAAGAGLAAKVTIPIPDDLPPSTLGRENEGVFWELEIHGRAPGLDYAAGFSVPVLAADQTVL